MIFISGPVVVLPSEAICLQTIYPQHTNSSNAEWYKTKDNTTTKLQFGAAGCSITTSKCQSNNPQNRDDKHAGKRRRVSTFLGNYKKQHNRCSFRWYSLSHRLCSVQN